MVGRPHHGVVETGGGGRCRAETGDAGRALFVGAQEEIWLGKLALAPDLSSAELEARASYIVAYGADSMALSV